jgi:hypothetical protein
MTSSRYGTVTVNQCQCGGVFDDERSLIRHIGASNNYDVLDDLIRKGDMDGYRARLHSNMTHQRERTAHEYEREQLEVERLQDARLAHPKLNR